jgi:hypothetical protein
MADKFELDEDEIAFLLDASEATFQQLEKRVEFIQRLAPDRLDVIRILKMMIQKRKGEAAKPPTTTVSGGKP